jgi:anti-sigma B factor antagonist
MEIQRQELPFQTLYRLNGRFDAHETIRFKQQTEHIDRDVCLDLSNVRFIDSSAIACLIGLNRRCQETGHQFKIIQVQDTVRLILEITNLLQLLPVELHQQPVGQMPLRFV